MSKGRDKKRSSKERSNSTLAALLEEKPKRGRPKRAIPRQSVYVALTVAQKQQISELAGQLPEPISRADLPDMAIILLTARVEALRQAVADRERAMPEGVRDVESLYYLWDLPLPDYEQESKWTSIRLSPQQVVQFGRLQGTFNALFGANRSQVFALALALLQQYAESEPPAAGLNSLSEFEAQIDRTYL